jgi:hypothetical protein
MLFGAIEMGLTTFVVGLLDRRDEALLERARDQVSEIILRGLQGPTTTTTATEAPWTTRSAMKSRPARRG